LELIVSAAAHDSFDCSIAVTISTQHPLLPSNQALLLLLLEGKGFLGLPVGGQQSALAKSG
jgi:hypothetical protein